MTENPSPVAVHEDPEDEEQTVLISQLGTTAALTKAGTIVDTVEYHNLLPGRTYTMQGTLYDRETDEAIEGAVGQITFTPEAADGMVEVSIDTSTLTGLKTIVYEECYLDGRLVGVHKDPTAKSQQVDLPEPTPKEKTPENTPTPTPVPGKTPTPTAPTAPTPPITRTPITGDIATDACLLALALVGASAGLAWGLRRKPLY